MAASGCELVRERRQEFVRAPVRFIQRLDGDLWRTSADGARRGLAQELDIVERSFDNMSSTLRSSIVDSSTPLAFVDVETTGLSPAENRIAEIGVIAVDGDRAVRWTTMVRTPSSSRRSFPADVDLQQGAGAPSFRDIALELAQMLAGRVLVAHNARFDHAFLRAEFTRSGIAFDPQVLCSVMLSRSLYPRLAHHDLDSLAQYHGLRVELRHRALPDADLVWQLWQTFHREHSEQARGHAIDCLLAGPIVPAELDPSLIDRLPESPGAYVFHGEHNQPLVVGAAGNLRLHVLNYFRVDRATDKALECAHRITNITWRATRGLLGAQLHAATIDAGRPRGAQRRSGSTAFTLQLSPESVPSVTIVRVAARGSARSTESFGVFDSERKARNVLVRLAARHGLCHGLLGISGIAKEGCRACPVERQGGACLGKIGRKKQLMRVFDTLRPLRLPIWPHHGPVGIRERSDIHVVDHWQFLGTAHSESEVWALLENHHGEFNRRLHRLLGRTLTRLPRSKLVDLSGYAVSECSVAMPADTEP
jgi:DNA polymerase III subunit epsilon